MCTVYCTKGRTHYGWQINQGVLLLDDTQLLMAHVNAAAHAQLVVDMNGDMHVVEGVKVAVVGMLVVIQAAVGLQDAVDMMVAVVDMLVVVAHGLVSSMIMQSFPTFQSKSF